MFIDTVGVLVAYGVHGIPVAVIPSVVASISDFLMIANAAIPVAAPAVLASIVAAMPVALASIVAIHFYLRYSMTL